MYKLPLSLVLAFLLASLPAFSGPVAVLVDVSGTMKGYGNWQGDACALVETILGGKPELPEAWRVTGSASSAAGFKLEPGARIHLVLFGSAQSNTFPFFQTVEALPELGRLRERFPLSPGAYTQARTNKTLAQAVGARLAADPGGEARVIVISDFLVDSDLSAGQLEFANQFESQAQVESPAIFSWAKEPRVQVKLLRFRLSAAAAPQAAPAAAAAAPAVRLLGVRLIDSNPRRAQFSWRVEGGAAPESCRLVVRDLETRRTVWSASHVLGNSAAWINPTPGRRTWQVVATHRDGSETSSPAVAFSVPSRGPSPLLWVALAVGVIAALYYFSSRGVRKRREGGPPPAAGGASWKG